MGRSNIRFVSDMTPSVERKRMKLVMSIAIGIIVLGLLIFFFLFSILVEFGTYRRITFSMKLFGILISVSTAVVVLYYFFPNKPKKDRPYNFITAYNKGLMVERRVLNNDIPLKNFIPYQNIEYVSKDYKDYVKKLKNDEALGMDLSRRTKWIPRGGLWIGLSPSEYRLLIKLKKKQEIGIPVYEAKTKTTRERVDLTDVVLISIRPKQQNEFLSVVKEGISSADGMEDITDRYRKRAKVKRSSIHDVVKTEFETSLTKKNIRSKFIRSYLIFTAIVSIFVVIITPIIISTSSFSSTEPGEMAAYILLTECLVLFFMIPVILGASLLITLLSSNMKSVEKFNKVYVGRNYLEVRFSPYVKNQLLHINKFPRKDIVLVRPVKDRDIDKRINKGLVSRLYGIRNWTNISLHNLFVKRENLLLVKFNKKMKIYHSHLKRKWYRSTRGEYWTKEIIIDIPLERHDDFIDLVFS